MRSLLRRLSGGYGSLILLWMSTRMLPLIWFNDDRHWIWEVYEVRKLLEYGFWARKGALLAPNMYFGVLPNPADYNYVNHPYPILWFYAFIYWLTGPLALLVLMSLIGLLGCLLTYKFLKASFPAGAAWFSAALFVIAHANVEFDIDINTVAEGALIWPFAAMAIIALRDPKHPFNRSAPWLLGGIVFLAGQTSWFALSAIPALLVLCLPEDVSLRAAIRRPWFVRAWPHILIGGTISLLLFIGQILAYSPSLHGNADYLRTQMGVGNLVSARLAQLPVLGLRLLLAGPALWLGTMVGLILYRNASPPHRRLVGTMLLNLAVFLLVVLTIPRLVFLNQHAFRYTLFPCAVITAFGLTRLNLRWIRGMLAGVALIGLLFCYAKLHDYQSSVASLTLGRWIASSTAPQDVVLSNVKYLLPPIEPWDGEFANNVREMSDRLYFQDICDSESFRQTSRPFASHFQTVCFLREASQPLDGEFANWLEREGTEVLSTNLVTPPQGLPLYKRARASVWRILKGYAPQYAPANAAQIVETNAFVIRMYRLAPSTIKSLDARLEGSTAGGRR